MVPAAKHSAVMFSINAPSRVIWYVHSGWPNNMMMKVRATTKTLTQIRMFEFIDRFLQKQYPMSR